MNNQLTIDELRAYQAGHLDGPAQHRVERLLLEEPFYADALEGLEALQRKGASLPKQTAPLRQALHERIHKNATERRLFPLWVTTMAASIGLMIGVALYVIYTNDPARKPVSQPAQPIEVDMGLERENIQKTIETVDALQVQPQPKSGHLSSGQLVEVVKGLNQAETEAFSRFISNNASTGFKGPLSVRIRTNRDGSVQRVNVENGILIKKPDGRLHREYLPSAEVRAEAERLVRQYPHWPQKKQWLIWVIGF